MLFRVLDTTCHSSQCNFDVWKSMNFFFSMRLSTRVKAGVEGVQVVSGWISVRCMREFQSKNPSWSRGAEDWEALVTKDANVDACLGG